MSEGETLIGRLLYAAARGSPLPPGTARALLRAILARMKEEDPQEEEGETP